MVSGADVPESCVWGSAALWRVALRITTVHPGEDGRRDHLLAPRITGGLAPKFVPSLMKMEKVRIMNKYQGQQ